ncbi:MAG: GntR family transcriptional regulator [Eubacteriales bacterium]
MGKPMYQKVKDKLISEIENAAPNTPILSERELADQFKVSRMTVRRSVQELVMEGYLYTNKNKGTFVADEKLRKTNVSVEMLEMHDKYKIIHFNMREPDKYVRNKLEMGAGDACTRLVRVNYKGKFPASVDEIYINSKYINNDKLEPVKFLEQFIENMDVMVAKKDFIPMMVPVKYAHLLNMELEIPIIKIETTYLSVKGQPYIYSNSYNNPEQVQISITT